jgi:colanic acid biosynthesis glycosyl transferase WcaI
VPDVTPLRSASKPRLAIFSPFYHPEPISTGKVNTLLAKEFVRQGWEIDVVCSHPLYPEWKPRKSDSELPSTTFYRGGGWVRYSASPVLRRLGLEIWFAAHTVLNALRLPKEIDIALMVYPPSLFGPLVWLMLPRKVRRVALVHDLQSEYLRNGFHTGASMFPRLIARLERRSLKGADRCIFFSNDIARVAQDTLSLDGQHMVVQYPFVTINDGSPATDDLESVLPRGVRHVVYAGALGEKQSPYLLATLMEKAAQTMPDARFHIFSAGPIFDALRKQQAAGSLLQLHGLLPEEQLSEMYSRSAVQLVPQAPGTENGSLPSKLPNLLASGVQVMAIGSGSSEVATLLRAAGTGTLVDGWDERSFLQGVGSALAEAAEVTPEARRASAAEVLQMCQVSSLAELIAG